MTRARLYTRNIIASWSGYTISVLVIFFLSPFLIHTLGPTKYGVWSLMISLTGYLGLIEFGTQAGIGRYINYYIGKNEPSKVNGIASTGFAIFLAVGAVLMLVGGGLAATIHLLFAKIPPELISPARWVALLVAANLGLSLLCAPFRLVIQARERFDLSNGIELLVLAIRTAMTVAVLVDGLGLVALAAVEILASLLRLAFSYFVAHRVFPELELGFGLVQRERFMELLRFSGWAFVGTLGYRILSSTDAVLIAIFLGPKWVTFYAIGDLLIQRSANFVQRSTQVFHPSMMQGCAREDFPSVCDQYRRSVNLGVAVGVLLVGGLIGFGETFIELWLGSGFELSYQVMVILAIAYLFSIPFSASLPIFSGLNRLKVNACVSLAQAISNLGLSIFLVMGVGMQLDGIAWGTFFPQVFFSMAGTYLALRMIGFSLTDYARLVLSWIFAFLMFTVVCTTLQSIHFWPGWSGFVVQVVIATCIFIPIALMSFLDRNDREWLCSKVAPGRIQQDVQKSQAR